MSADAFLAPWSDIARILVVGALAYVGLVVFLRVTGKRTLTKLNAFDLVVTVALGSTLATILLSRDVALVEGLTAFALLILLQWVVTYASVRSQPFQTLVKATPTLLVHRGAILEDALRKERVSREEVLAVVRSSGATDLTDVGAVILETDGSFSVLSSAPAPDAGRSTLATVETPTDGADDQASQRLRRL
ncbi:DUF421 domain-containing protein [Salinarimonas ramus]|uniref:DUF421 domain-containing protein n=1 Tax=Salinarimonas ramus TaxID=690164 RepID=A0A917Q6I4_9HYPH|nr:YetF domain-containing protein [Salinarimonas ramus]GGK31964.1 DUF421 domain-containing protein [Salinarimonas ramus]